jgi:hypothetical protein
MLARTPIQTLFYRYVAARDPSDHYLWTSWPHCACGQFVREENIDTNDREMYHAIWGRYPDDEVTPCTEWHPASLNAIARGDGSALGWTFGALRVRLEAAGYGK